MSVRLSDVALNGCLQVCRAGESTALQTAPAQHRKPALNQVQPRCTRRRKMQMNPRVPHQPVVNQLRLVRLQMVEHEMHLKLRLNAAVDLLQELAKLHTAMTLLAAA